MLQRLLALILIAGGAYAGYTYGFNKGFDSGIALVTNGPVAKLTEKPKPEVAPDLENMKRAITASWQSVADKKLVRAYTESGEVVDSYANKKISTGVFTLFSSASVKEDEVSFKLDKGRVYIKVEDLSQKNDTGTSTDQSSYFRIDLISPTDLKLSVVGENGGKTFTFKRL